MSKYFIVIIFWAVPYCGFSQSNSTTGLGKVSKPALDTSILGKWPKVNNPCISPNGHYAVYTYGPNSGPHTMVILSTDLTWKQEFENVDRLENYFFSADSRKFIFRKGETLFVLTLATDKMERIDHAHSYATPKTFEGRWLAYLLNDHQKKLVLRDLLKNTEQEFNNVSEYVFDDLGKTLLFTTQEKKDDSTAVSLYWFDLLKRKSSTVWSSLNSTKLELTVGEYKFDERGKQLAFTIQRTGDKISNEIWYYKPEMNQAELKVNDKSPGIEDGLFVDGNLSFSKNGSWLFFSLKKTRDIRKTSPDASKVFIWNYQDIQLQPDQLLSIQQGSDERALAVVSVLGSNVVRLENEDEVIRTDPEKITGNYVIVRNHKYLVDHWWPDSIQPDYYIISLKDGKRKLWKHGLFKINEFKISFSPNGRYMIFWDFLSKAWWSYDFKSDREQNLTQKIPVSMSKDYITGIYQEPVDDVAGWYKADTSLVLYDNYDVWRVDPTGQKIAVNITNNYGVRNRVRLRISDDISEGLSGNESLLLTGLNDTNKHNGIYRIKFNRSNDPELLTEGPYTFYHTESQKAHYYFFDNGMAPLKARKANCWLVKRQSAEEAPNYYFTRDFKRYIMLSQLAPQKTYNWLTSELITWKMYDGRMSQGILYKPENFDSTKKYPIIFNYYEALSHRLYEFAYPEFTRSNINIPWFVSNGYLVFTPDIYYGIAAETGMTVGEYAYNAVGSAAEYLAHLPYVDKNRMGIQGHSFGGGETVSILTQTNLFVAAAEAAGTTDRISAYLTLAPAFSSIEHLSKQEIIETGQGRFGATPWERPDLFQKNSEVLNANKIFTPLLIMHNEKDNSVQWRQGIELYMALRRLEKKVWMLQYEDGIHYLRGKDAIDYTIRIQQFFDHYLKGLPPPKWMTVGIPARLKGIETGYELDPNGSCGKDCKICKEKKYNNQ